MSGVAGAVSAVSKYVPTSVIGTYATLNGLIGSATPALSLIVFFFLWFATPLVVLIGAGAIRRGPADTALTSIKGIRVWPVLAPFIAFAPWAATISESSLHTYFGWLTAQVGGVAVVLIAFLFPLVDTVLGDPNAKAGGA